MPFAIDPSDPRPIYVQVMDEIRRGIVLGNWRADDMLPSVRQLAVELRINPNTVQQAYRELEREGVVYVRRGQGTHVVGQDAARERRRMLRGLAKRMLQEAYRHGVELGELISALEAEAAGQPELRIERPREGRG
jgi:GntR family transcriptional regulator